MNDELRNRGLALNSANSFLESVFASLRTAVIVVDRDLRITVWNDRSTELWGMRPDEVLGSDLLSLDIGLPVSELRSTVRDVVNGKGGHVEVALDATSRRGKPVRCRVSVSPLQHADRSSAGAILLTDELQAVVDE